jgi:competence protein ComEA
MSPKIKIAMFFVMALSAIAVIFLAASPGKEADEAYIHLLEEADGETLEIASSASELLQEDEKAQKQNSAAGEKSEETKQSEMAEEKSEEIKQGETTDKKSEKTKQGETTQEKSEEIKQGETAEENQTIFVYVCGKVKKPGVYELSEDSRLSDFIKAAGGFTKKAAREYLNLALKAEDGQKLYVPSKKEVAAMKKDAGKISLETETLEETSGNKEGSTDSNKAESNENDGNETDSEKVNINTAGKEELMTLSGIGEAKADAIIAYREANGAFHSTEEIMQISGIKEGIYQKISNDITT